MFYTFKDGVTAINLEKVYYAKLNVDKEWGYFIEFYLRNGSLRDIFDNEEECRQTFNDLFGNEKLSN